MRKLNIVRPGQVSTSSPEAFNFAQFIAEKLRLLVWKGEHHNRLQTCRAKPRCQLLSATFTAYEVEATADGVTVTKKLEKSCLALGTRLPTPPAGHDTCPPPPALAARACRMLFCKYLQVCSLVWAWRPAAGTRDCFGKGKAAGPTLPPPPPPPRVASMICLQNTGRILPVATSTCRLRDMALQRHKSDDSDRQWSRKQSLLHLWPDPLPSQFCHPAEGGLACCLVGAPSI